MRMNPYLTFNGQCEAAFKFYEQCLGGKIEAMLRFSEMPASEGTSGCAEMPPEMANQIMHACMTLNGQLLMASDAPPGHFEKPAGFSVSLNVDSPEEAERIYLALAENGTQTMPLQETFWAARFGMLVDQFGTPWMVNCENAAESCFEL